MLHYETKLRLHKAVKERGRIGILTTTLIFKGYGYGYISIENGNYKAFVNPSFLDRSKIIEISNRNSNSSLRIKESNYVFKNIDSATEYILDYFIFGNKIGEFTDLKNIKEIINYLERGKLDFLIFEEDKIREKEERLTLS